jgi:hypothetical protein
MLVKAITRLRRCSTIGPATAALLSSGLNGAAVAPADTGASRIEQAAG